MLIVKMHTRGSFSMLFLVGKIKGSILAMAIGDALGAAVEGYSSDKIANIYGQLREFSQIEVFYSSVDERTDISEQKKQKLRNERRPVGLYTDDTQQAVLLIESLVESGKADRYDYAQRIVDVVTKTRTKSNPLGVFRGYGPGFKQVVENLMKGVSPDESAIDSAGNGAAMRIAPVGLFFADNPEKAAQSAVEISLLTHKDIRAILSACAVAVAVSLAIQTKEIHSRTDFFETIISYLHTIELPDNIYKQKQRAKHFFTSADILAKHLPDSYEITANQISRYASKITNKKLSAESPFCLCSVMMSFWHFLHHRESTEEAIISAVNSGGDTDTISAITGAMIGALRAKRSVPQHWLGRLKNRYQLELRAKAITERTLQFGDWQDFIEMEQNIS